MDRFWLTPKDPHIDIELGNEEFDNYCPHELICSSYNHIQKSISPEVCATVPNIMSADQPGSIDKLSYGGHTFVRSPKAKQSTQHEPFFGYCYFCDYPQHSQHYCPLKYCDVCHIYGHSNKVCEKNANQIYFWRFCSFEREKNQSTRSKDSEECCEKTSRREHMSPISNWRQKHAFAVTPVWNIRKRRGFQKLFCRQTTSTFRSSIASLRPSTDEEARRSKHEIVLNTSCKKQGKQDMSTQPLLPIVLPMATQALLTQPPSASLPSAPLPSAPLPSTQPPSTQPQPTLDIQTSLKPSHPMRFFRTNREDLTKIEELTTAAAAGQSDSNQPKPISWKTRHHLHARCSPKFSRYNQSLSKESTKELNQMPSKDLNHKKYSSFGSTWKKNRINNMYTYFRKKTTCQKIPDETQLGDSMENHLTSPSNHLTPPPAPPSRLPLMTLNDSLLHITPLIASIV